MGTNKVRKIGGNLKVLPKDNRDFKLSAILKLPPLEELPEEFELKPLVVHSQLNSDYCTQEASCGVSELQEEVELSPEWCFAVSKMISGDPEDFGQDLRTAVSVHTKYGAIEKSEAPYSIQDTEDEIIRYINNWPKELFEKALKHRKKSYFKVDGQYDAFDDIRAYIWKFKGESRACVLGLEWSWPLEQEIMDKVEEYGGGHAVYCRGWKKINGITYLIIQNSYDKEAGNNGSHCFSREIINKFAEKYGVFTFVDMPEEEAKQVAWSKCRRVLETIKKFFGIK
jgi:hypothetical protein